MAICKDKKRNLYFISYKIKLATGEVKTRNIRNKNWNKKSLVKDIELEEIEKDKIKHEKIELTKSKDLTFKNIYEIYINNLDNKSNTIYSKNLLINKYFSGLLNNLQTFNEILNSQYFVDLLKKDILYVWKLMATLIHIIVQF